MFELDEDSYKDINGLVEEVERDLIELERFKDDKSLMDRILRNLHTFKGAVGMFGLNELQDVSHKMEDFLKGVDKKEYSVTSTSIGVLLSSSNFLSSMLNHAAGKRDDIIASTTILDDLGKIIASPEEEVRVEPQISGDMEDVLQEVMDDLKSTRKEDEAITIEADVFQRILAENSRHNEGMAVITRILEKNSHHPSIAKLKKLYEAKVIGTADKLSTVINEACLESFDSILSDIPAQAAKMARPLGKSVEVIIYGNDEKVDRYIVRKIREPLIHILRNSIDHGGQTPEERTALGKMEKNTITIMVMLEDEKMLFSIEDDGKGIAAEKIKEKALEKGLATEEEIAKMPDNEIFQFIFHPGFSTATQTTSLSGRGVGMDVVKTNIDKLGGTMEIDSTPNCGTSIKFIIPLYKSKGE